eukprot:scaffold31862_cov63-Phaeocystis_antarctica.AAC.4
MVDGDGGDGGGDAAAGASQARGVSSACSKHTTVISTGCAAGTVSCRGRRRPRERKGAPLFENEIGLPVKRRPTTATARHRPCAVTPTTHSSRVCWYVSLRKEGTVKRNRYQPEV